MNVLSLFDGMSCGQIALNRAYIPYSAYYASEIDDASIYIAKKNYPATIHLGNVVDLDANSLPKIDLLIGGSPCQSFSIAGNKKGFDGKSGLFWEYVRVLNEVNPRYFLFENVVMKKEWADVISNSLGVNGIKINSSLVSAQNRSRVYWTNIPNVSPPKDRGVLLKHILDTDAPLKYRLSDSKISRVLTASRGKGFFYTMAHDKCGTLISGYSKLPTDGIYIDLGFKRRLTPNECELLQTVPLDYTHGVSDRQRYRMLGNGWTVDIIAHILSYIPNE